MTQVVNVPVSGYMSYTGSLRARCDIPAGGNAVLSLASQQIGYALTDNSYVPDVVDANALQHLRVLGVRAGVLSHSGPLLPDRGIADLINLGFGPRLGPNSTLYGFLLTLLPNGTATAVLASMLFYDTLQITASFGVPGQQNMVSIQASGSTTDPDNLLGSTIGSYTAALAAPTLEGLPGAGISSFASMIVSNGASSSPTLYDGVTRIRITLRNRLVPSPKFVNSNARLIAGMIPGPLMGTVEIEQLQGATNPLPSTGALIPVSCALPTGDGTHTLTLHTSLEWQRSGANFAPTTLATRANTYGLFGTSATNGTGTAAMPWSVVAVYV